MTQKASFVIRSIFFTFPTPLLIPAGELRYSPIDGSILTLWGEKVKNKIPTSGAFSEDWMVLKLQGRQLQL